MMHGSSAGIGVVGPNYGGAAPPVKKAPNPGDVLSSIFNKQNAKNTGINGGGGGKAQTTVINGKAMVKDANGKWVEQTSATGSTAINGGGGGGVGTTIGGMPILNNAQKDPQIQKMQGNLNNRYDELNAKEGQMDPFLQESINNLRGRQSADTTQRAIDRANSGAADQAAGAMSQLGSAAARSGRGEGYGGNAVQGASQRLASRQAADISLGREKDLDALTIAGHNILKSPSDLATTQSGQANNFLLGASGQANMAGNLALGQQGLGLEQWKAGTDANYKQALLNKDSSQDMFNNYLKILQTLPS